MNNRERGFLHETKIWTRLVPRSLTSLHRLPYTSSGFVSFYFVRRKRRIHVHLCSSPIPCSYGPSAKHLVLRL